VAQQSDSDEICIVAVHTVINASSIPVQPVYISTIFMYIVDCRGKHMVLVTVVAVIFIFYTTVLLCFCPSRVKV